jgi:hypothetical protein
MFIYSLIEYIWLQKYIVHKYKKDRLKIDIVPFSKMIILFIQFQKLR